MLQDIFATKLGMTQAWTKTGKRLAITRCVANENRVVGVQNHPLSTEESPRQIFEIGYGTKKLKNTPKPLRARMQKSGFSVAPQIIVGVKPANTNNEEDATALVVGSSLSALDILSVGDVVKVQGITKGRGFAGAMKRHGFKGGPKTHGQSDRSRAVGSIGAGTTPGRVIKGKRMPGRYGQDTQSVTGLVVVFIDKENKEVWLSGTVPGVISSNLKITKTGKQKNIDLDMKASGIKVQEVVVPSETAATGEENGETA